MEVIDHPFHPQHKLAYQKEVKNSLNSVVCAACVNEISSEHYNCGKCKFFLHKLCAQQPLELRHPYHPPHPLHLLQKGPHLNNFCYACQIEVEGFIYHCAICYFDLCFICASNSKQRLLCHIQHNLTLEKIVKRADKGVVCALCVKEISGPFADYHSCRKCNFFVHDLCFKRPQELTSSLHPEHPLILSHKRVQSTKPRFCNGCRQKVTEDCSYHCHTCEFNLHFNCAFPEPEKRVKSFVDVHHHPLMLITRPAKFNCDVCSSQGDDDEDQSYICSIPTCDFWVHKMCAFTTLTQQYKGHHHPLSLIQGVTEDLKIYDDIYCYVCRKTLYPTDWVSHCARCTFFVHIMCMTTCFTDPLNSVKDDVDYFEDSFIKLLLNGDEFVDWPLRDLSSDLIQPFLLKKNNIIVDVQLKIRHLSHKEHDMMLFEELHVNNDSFFEEEDEEIMCDACIHPITAPYYCCQECNYYLHLACANLPPKIKHFTNPDHELTIVYLKCHDVLLCNRCGNFGNGFFYLSKISYVYFALDLTCAALPAMIMHETHEHPLRQTQVREDGACYACGDSMHNDGTVSLHETIFKCTHCNISLHLDCALRPRSIRHRWDRQHPIDLKFPPHDRSSGHFMCDMCEEYIHPMYWLYSCFDCEISFHTNCIPKYSYRNTFYDSNVQYGRKVHTNSHPHTLKFLRQPTLKITCDKCERDIINRGMVYECETCYHCICHWCVEKEPIILV